MVTERPRNRLSTRCRHLCIGRPTGRNASAATRPATQPNALVVTQRERVGIHEHARRIYLGISHERRWQRSEERDTEEPGRFGQRLGQPSAILVYDRSADLLHVLTAEHRPRYGDLHHE